jgi:hypothetical protein
MARAAGVEEGEPTTADPQLGRGESLFWYGAATVSYIGASIVEKSLLNWFVGPLWLVGFVWLGPIVTDRLRRLGRRR